MNKPALSALLLVIGGCSDTCGNTVVSRLPAPDKRHEAVLFQRDCGATTGFSTQISILDAGRDVSGAGDAFRADDDHGAARTGAWGGPWADIRWLASIEESRLADGSPPLPSELQHDYEGAWAAVLPMALQHLAEVEDDLVVRGTLAVIAHAKGQHSLGAIALCTEDEREEMLAG